MKVGDRGSRVVKGSKVSPAAYKGRTVSPPQAKDSRPLIGTRLRDRRRSLNRTVESIADEVGVTKGFLSDVERDKASPSVTSLVRLCDALGISVGSLFAGKASKIVRSEARRQIRFGGEKLQDYLLTDPAVTGFMVLWSVLEPGGGGGEELYSIPSEDSFALVINGKMDIVFQSEVFRLDSGDAMTWKSRTPHTFRNGSLTQPAVVVFVMTPAPR